MEFVTLNNGVDLPALGLGVFQTPPEETRVAVETALADGYQHVDTAAAYGNERQVGEAIRNSGLERPEVFVETKIWIEDVPAFVELESGGPPPVTCRVVGVGRPPSHPTKEGDRREQHLSEGPPSCPA